MLPISTESQIWGSGHEVELGNGTGNLQVLLRVPVPVSTTHRQQVTGNKHTIIKPPYKQGLIGVGWITGGPRRQL